MYPVDHNPSSTQRHAILGIEAELEAEGFEHAELIGRGGFGAVYRCTERALARPVAVKVLRSGYGDTDLERFLREQRSMGLLSGHPNIVTVLHVDITATGESYLVLPYYSRGSLHDAIEESGPLDAANVLAIGVKLAGALETAHRRGILHRDVKPANVLISDYREPQLCDFGIAHLTGGFETGKGEVTGSPAYTAPEVLLGRPSTVRSDVYGLGATLFTALSGHVPFQRAAGEGMVAHFVRLTREPVPTAVLPEQIGSALADAMAQQPQQRPASAAEFGQTLRNLQQQLGFPVTEMPIDAAADADSGPPPARAPQPPRSGVVVPATPNTRFRPARAPRELVPRPRLARLLSRCERKRLTLIHAPAGFGKSCAAIQLAEQLAESGVRIAWLTIGSEDNNGVTFCAHLVDALQRVDPGFDSRVGLALQEAGSEAERFVLTSVINDIHRRKQQTAVVIDDWDAVSSDATRADLRFLLDQACHHLQLIVTTRTRSGLALSALRVHDELVEIDSTALRFTAEETQALLSRSGGITMGSGEVARLTESTEGWVAALQLAALSLRHHQRDPAELLDAISGSHYAIGEFLAENVLDALEPELVEFMMVTALPRRICASLAATLTEVTNGQSMLELVEERNLFLRRLDENGEWFRYHHLFADFLQRRLERIHRERIPQLHRRAAEWFAEHGELDDAVAHALIAGDDDRAAEWVENAGFTLLEQGQLATLLALADSLPEQAAARRPQLQLIVALVNISLRQDDAARVALGRAAAALDRDGADPGEMAELRTRCQVIEGVSALLSDRTEGTAELIAAALAEPDRFDAWYPAAAAVVAAFLDITRFDFEAAKTCRERAAQYFNGPRSQLSHVYAYCMSAIAAHEQLDIRETDYFLRKAMLVAMAGHRTPSLSARLVGALLGEILYERNDIAEAETYLDAAHELGANLGSIDFMIAIYVTGSRAKAALGKFAEARARLADGMRVATELRLPRLAAHIVAEQIRRGDTDLPTPDPPDESPEPTGVPELTRDMLRGNFIQYALRPGSGIAPEVATAAAQRLADKLTAQRRPRALSSANLLLAQCLSNSGQPDQARRLAATTTADLAEIGLLRPILDAGPNLWALLTDSAADPSIPPLAESVRQAIAAEQSARRRPADS